MKSYLDLIPISARVHSKGSRLTRYCIVLAVFLVTVIFSMADMEIRSQIRMAKISDGGWHAGYKMIDENQAALIKARPEVKNTSWYAVENYSISEGFTVAGTETVICGFEEGLLKIFPATEVMEGSFPSDENGVVITQSVKERLKLDIGDEIILQTPQGLSLPFQVTGFAGNASMLTQADAFGLYMNLQGYERLSPMEEGNMSKFIFYVELSSKANIRNTIDKITAEFGLSGDQVGVNSKLLGLIGQSDDNFFIQLYGSAALLSVLVITAGVLMMTSSLNSNIAQRTQFFGMMSCLGATGKQIRRFVRREALSWCKKAVPAGLLLGVGVVWMLCAMLKTLSPGFFGGMPSFGISWAGILLGCIVGLLTVLLAARTPARKAARVSPLTAVSGNSESVSHIKRAASTRFLKIETALGIHHAVGSKRNLILMMCSFAFSIILFLAFTTGIDFMNHAIKPIKPYAPDIVVASPEPAAIPLEMTQAMEGLKGVKKVFGRMISLNVPAQINGQDTYVNLISYEKNQFEWAKKKLLEGSSKGTEESEQILFVYNTEISVNTGDTLSIAALDGSRELQISGILSDTTFHPVSGVNTIICSESTFRQLTGKSSYDVLDIQLTSNASDKDVDALRSHISPQMEFQDYRLKNSEAKGAFYSMALFVYGFLIIIGLIAAMHIINSIAISVTARMHQYGAMRAVGMSAGQLMKMVSAEAAVYAIAGILAGCGAGLPINKFLYEKLVTFRWGTQWYLPMVPLLVIIITIAAASVLAVFGPGRRIRKMTIVDTIGAQ